MTATRTLDILITGRPSEGCNVVITAPPTGRRDEHSLRRYFREFATAMSRLQLVVAADPFYLPVVMARAEQMHTRTGLAQDLCYRLVRSELETGRWRPPFDVAVERMRLDVLGRRIAATRKSALR